MSFVLDASVAVAALRTTEIGHAAALRRCMPVFAGREEIRVPAIFDVEIVAALVRRGAPPARVAAFLDTHFSSRILVAIGPRAVRAVRAVVNVTRLRAADAMYVWLAARDGLPLVTTDAEVLERAGLAGAEAVLP